MQIFVTIHTEHCNGIPLVFEQANNIYNDTAANDAEIVYLPSDNNATPKRPLPESIIDISETSSSTDDDETSAEPAAKQPKIKGEF